MERFNLRMRDIVLILQRCALRHWRLAWRQQLMLLLILALGTAVYVAMRLANRSALAGFERFTETLTRDSDWTLRAAAGPMQEEWLAEMRAALGVRPVALLPVIEATVVPHEPRRETSIGERPTWRLVGMDLIAMQNFRSALPLAVSVPKFSERSCFASEAMARRQGWQPGSTFQVVINDKVVDLTLAEVMPILPDMPAPPDDLLLMDLPAAQTLLYRPGGIDRVEVICPSGPAFPELKSDIQEPLTKASRDRWQMVTRDDRRALAGSMTDAFRLNLTVLSLLALLVGGYLMFQALDGVVIRRRDEIAILRALGVTEGSIQRAFLAEAGLLGMVAGALGVAMGWAGAQLAVHGVARTMTALYGASSATYAELYASEALLGIGLCVITSLVAAWWPARQAAGTPPAQVLGRHAVPWQGGKLWSTAWAGLALCGLACVLAEIGPLHLNGMRLPLAAYAAALLWMLGAGLAAGRLLRLCSPRANSPVRSVAFSYLRTPSVRHRFAIAALTSAVAMTCGMAIMIASFDHTMRNWVVRSMKADIYISSAGAQSASSTHQIPASTLEALRAQPEVVELAGLQHASVTLPDGPVHVLGADASFTQRHDLYSWVARPSMNWWKQDAPMVLINESLSERLRLAAGSELDLPTVKGTRRVRIAGIYADYGNERGSITLPQERFREWYESDMAWRAALMIKPGVDSEALRSRLQRQHPGLSIFTQSHLRSEALRIFRQTFAVTYALEAVGVVVAVAGLGLALASLMLDRRQDLFTLRAVGFTSRNVATMGAWEGGGIALAGIVAGVGSGLWLGWLLIYRVNKQSFGWTLEFSFPVWQVTALALAVMAAGVAVASMVGKWSARLQVEREE